MNLIYSHSFKTAHDFAIHHDMAPGDWKWIHDADVVRHNPRADVFKVERWQANPHKDKIDLVLERMRQTHRLGTIVEVGESSGGTMGMSG